MVMTPRTERNKITKIIGFLITLYAKFTKFNNVVNMKATSFFPTFFTRVFVPSSCFQSLAMPIRTVSTFIILVFKSVSCRTSERTKALFGIIIDVIHRCPFSTVSTLKMAKFLFGMTTSVSRIACHAAKPVSSPTIVIRLKCRTALLADEAFKRCVLIFVTLTGTESLASVLSGENFVTVFASFLHVASPLKLSAFICKGRAIAEYRLFGSYPSPCLQL